MTAVVFAALVIAGGAVWHFGTAPANGVRLDAVRADVEQNLPVGSSRDEVRAWLAGHGITDTGDLMNTGGRVDGLWALLPNDTWFEPAEIHFLFRFDKEWKLKTATVYRSRRDRSPATD
ncbi:MAG: hypothetical protein J0H99_15380 [Rhodospirillales bacterium]|nr:hypothetical protein [Rhodospirillales bacterium]